jgi:hypothetical protein
MSLSNAGEDVTGEGFSVEVQIYRIEMLLWVASHDPIKK